MAISSYREKCLEGSGAHCPSCESADITSGPIQADGPVTWAKVCALHLTAPSYAGFLGINWAAHGFLGMGAVLSALGASAIVAATVLWPRKGKGDGG